MTFSQLSSSFFFFHLHLAFLSSAMCSDKIGKVGETKKRWLCTTLHNFLEFHFCILPIFRFLYTRKLQIGMQIPSNINLYVIYRKLQRYFYCIHILYLWQCFAVQLNKIGKYRRYSPPYVDLKNVVHVRIWYFENFDQF